MIGGDILVPPAGVDLFTFQPTNIDSGGLISFERHRLWLMSA
jgi:hypothetical protein